MKPLIKYRGGKSKEISSFIKYIPEQFDTYFEPFFGGGAVFFYLEPRKAIINDVNAKLMGFYLDVKEKYDIVRQQLDELQAIYENNQIEYKRAKMLRPNERVENKNEALYYTLRDMFNHKIEPKYLDSVVYFFINKTAYSGMIRYNAQGEYNVPFGRYQNFNTQLGKTKTRESKDVSLAKFVKTKASNLRDYTDACFRYLRATGLVAISQKGKSLSILPEKMEEVKYFLSHIDRKPIYVTDENAYKAYLFDATLPVLYTDNRSNLEQEVSKLKEVSWETIKKSSVIELKKILKHAIACRKENLIKDQVKRLKDYQAYMDVMAVFDDIRNDNYYDVPLMLEWNTWRAMTMLDGGNIKANLKFDDNGQPMATASGNTADIICDYGNFSLTVEVTMQSGQRQYEMEGEPVYPVTL